MPQLAPMNWIALFMFSISLMILISVLIWWFFFPSFHSPTSHSTKSAFLWKW